MKTYNIAPKEIQVSDFTVTGIALGESGRGRQLTIVPCPDAPLLEPGLSKTGKPRLNKSSSSRGWVIRVSTHGAYIRGANGNVSSPTPEAWTVVARGYGAFGHAGRTGTWDDLVLATAQEEWILRVKPTRGDAYLLVCQNGKVSQVSYPEAEALDIDTGESTPSSRGDWRRL